jgi:hypothetical protein
MKIRLSSMNLKTRAMVVAAAVLFLVIAVNTLVNISVAASKYREALIARTTALAEGTWKDIAKAIGFGIPLSARDGMSDKLRGMMETDRDLSSVMIMDADGKVLYAADRALRTPFWAMSRERRPLPRTSL